jgi:hypothetical protein
MQPQKQDRIHGAKKNGGGQKKGRTRQIQVQIIQAC